MSHDELKALVADLAIGALEADEARRVEAHVAGCAGCQAELASLTGTAALLRELPSIPAPEAGEASLLDGARRAAERMAEGRRPVRRVPRWLLGLALGGAGAAAALVVTLQLGQRPASTFDEGRGALDGSGAFGAAAPPPEAKSAPLAAPAQDSKVEGLGGAAARERPAPSNLGAAPKRKSAPASAGIGEAARSAQAPAAPAPAPAAAPVADRSEDRLAEVAAEGASKAGGEAERYAAPPPAVMAKRAAPLAAAAKGESTAAAPPPEVRRTAGCTGEARRTLWRDAAGRVVRREREGTLGGVAYRISEAFGAGGGLTAARLEVGGRTVAADRAEVAEGRLAGLVPGLEVAVDAAAAEGAPPRCGP